MRQVVTPGLAPLFWPNPREFTPMPLLDGVLGPIPAVCSQLSGGVKHEKIGKVAQIPPDPQTSGDVPADGMPISRNGVPDFCVRFPGE